MDAALFLEAFHFLRPLWLALLPVILVLWWSVRRSARARGLRAEGIAPHLRQALTVGRGGAGRLRPVDGVALTLALAALGAAGPTWSRVPDPFAAQSAPAVVVLAVTPSMEAGDIAPSRLERGKQKIRDFLDLRAGARTALVAYAGTAHVVVPMTEDPGVMVPYLAGLSPDIMPAVGAAAADALALAEALLAEEADGGVGGILFVTDGIDPADVPALGESGQAVSVLAMLPDGARDRGIDALGLPVVPVTPDDADIRRIDALLNAAYTRAQLEDGDQPWEDRAHWLAWPAAALLLLWFRRGWTMRWTALAALAVACGLPGAARADGLVDWFLTPDQQGRLAYENRDFGRAAELFVDPLWRGYALYRHGQYEDAVTVLDRVETAEAAFIQGMAHIKSRGYRDGVRSFETAVARDPDFPGAAENLEQARRIVEYVEDLREAEDTGEDAGIGADEVVLDNEAGRGTETQMEVPEEGDGPGLMSTEQWMNTVDTRTGDFLRIRFAIEDAARVSNPVAADGGGEEGTE
ncbi:VWA domain-containing protein [Palleronia sp. KMU-117]|uniref:VWA domain-containing protein n=1 Tax=Palleronia sp. KMU-117 TaxID=3434108 RepID=UPI003D7618B2